MKKLLAIPMAAVALAGCSTAANTDLGQPVNTGLWEKGEVVGKAPDSLTVYYNVDGHPNIAVMCIEGFAVLTTKRDYEPWEYVADMNVLCRSGE